MKMEGPIPQGEIAQPPHRPLDRLLPAPFGLTSWRFGANPTSATVPVESPGLFIKHLASKLMAPRLDAIGAVRLCTRIYEDQHFDELTEINGQKWKLIQGPPPGGHINNCLKVVVLGPPWWPQPRDEVNWAAAAAGEPSGLLHDSVQLVVCYRGTNPGLAHAWANNAQLAFQSLTKSAGFVQALHHGESCLRQLCYRVKPA